MKSITTILLTPLLLTAPLASAFVAEMFPEANCDGVSLGERNVWDDSCGMHPFPSFQHPTHTDSPPQHT
jgi:hypothetical protein